VRFFVRRFSHTIYRGNECVEDHANASRRSLVEASSDRRARRHHEPPTKLATSALDTTCCDCTLPVPCPQPEFISLGADSVGGNSFEAMG
jgi:hypothetical protein